MSVYSQIKDKFVMPDAFSDWGDYRKQVTKLLTKDLTKEIVGYEAAKEGFTKTKMQPIYKKGGLSIAILGTGACNDVDIIELAEYFDSITLIDVDKASMVEATDWLPEIIREKITIKEGSITGITDADQEQFCNRMLSHASYYGNTMKPDIYNRLLLEELMGLGSRLYTKESMLSENGLLPVGGYDVVACLGVHSQLMALLSYTVKVLTHNISEQLLGGEEPDDRKITEYIKKMNTHIIPIINSAILKSSDQRAVFGNEYDGKHPVEGAYQCIMDLRRRGLSIKEQHLAWNFNPDQNVEYDMLIQVI